VLKKVIIQDLKSSKVRGYTLENAQDIYVYYHMRLRKFVYLIVVLICFKYILLMSKFDYLYYLLKWTVSRKKKF
jgi:hypothetical protein